MSDSSSDSDGDDNSSDEHDADNSDSDESEDETDWDPLPPISILYGLGSIDRPLRAIHSRNTRRLNRPVHRQRLIRLIKKSSRAAVGPLLRVLLPLLCHCAVCLSWLLVIILLLATAAAALLPWLWVCCCRCSRCAVVAVAGAPVVWRRGWEACWVG